MITTKRLSIVPTMRCTLRCKLCSNHIPDFKNPADMSVAEMKDDIDMLFKLFDHIEWLQFVGGEIFLHTGMAEIYEYCLKYQDKFDKIILESNATILPREQEIKILRQYGERTQVMISDYGKLSHKRNEFVNLLENNSIPYRLKKYNGDDQHFGGWIDNTGLCDLGESAYEVEKKAPKCAQVRLENMHCFRGQLHRCSNSLFLYELGLFEPNARDFLNIHDETLSVVEKQAVIADFYKTPRMSCRFCTWKDGDSAPRHSAAEQIC